MTMTLRIVVIVVSVLTTAMILRKIRQSKLQIEDSIFWIGFSSILILFSVFPCVPDFLSRLAGTYTTANFIYLAVIFLLILKMFHMSIKMIRSYPCRNFGNQSMFYQHIQIPIHGSQTNIRLFFSNTFIDHVRRRMIPSTLNIL